MIAGRFSRCGVLRGAAAAMLVCGLLWTACPGQTSSAPAAKKIPGKGSYAVVISAATYAQEAWHEVAEALRGRYQATVIVYPGPVAEARAALAEAFPKHVCFVAQPTEAGRDFVAAVHRLMRTLDDDPYTDAIWGILTGFEASDALRIARHAEPLVVRKAAAGTGIDLDLFDAGVWFSEGDKGVMYQKLPGQKPQRKQCPDDSTKALVDTFSDFRPDVFVTSGHATPRDWQIGYSYRNGQFRCRKGQLGGLDLQGNWHPINSPNPKVYLPVGNCLMGLVPDRDCMALAFMHTAGVNQMIGYTVLTWYGYGGWGVKDLFFGQAGRFSLAEAFYLNSQALIHQLRTRFPKSAGVNFERYDLERDRALLGTLARKHGLLDDSGRGLRNKDEMGLLWDRDTVAFYGDPAWDARLAKRDLAWKQEITQAGDVTTFRITTRQKGTWPGRPIMAMLPHRVADARIVQGAELTPVVTDNFILVPMSGEFAEGKTYQVAFRATKI